MSDDRYSLELSGCAPIPLAHYLKALGILRLVSEQADQQAKGWWEGDTFWLRSTLDREGLVEFFLEQYAPTPILAPWNGGCGLYKKWDPKTKRFKSREAVDALEAIEQSDSLRLVSYRRAILGTKESLATMAKKVDLDAELNRIRGISQENRWGASRQKKEIDDYLNAVLLFEVAGQAMQIEKGDKDQLLLSMRERVLGDDSLAWLDSAIVLVTGRKKNRIEAPLLGSGGNIGNSDFSARFMQLLGQTMGFRGSESSPKASQAFLRAALLGYVTPGLLDFAVDQFDPGSAGGANMSQGFAGTPYLNPWDYILMIEGATMFSGAVTRRLASHNDSSVFPFSVASSAVGSATDNSDQTRGEIWLPLWDRPCCQNELSGLFAEGRSQVGRRAAKTAVDFARAAATLGVDRGITAFMRFQFQKRLGDNYLATALGLFDIRYHPTCLLLDDIDRWFERFRVSAADTGKDRKPKHKRAARALRHFEAAILELCQRGGRRHVQNVLIALGQADMAVATSPRLRDAREKGSVSPVPRLSSKWLAEAYIGSEDIEFRLAAALASIGYRKEDKGGPFRRHIEPIDPNTWHSPWPKWSESADDPSLVWGSGSLVQNLLAVLNRRMVDAVRDGKQAGDSELLFPGDGCCHASLGDIAAFIDGRVDDRRIESLLQGLILVNWRDSGIFGAVLEMRGPPEPIPDAAYALLKLCHLPHAIAGKAVRLTPEITRRAASGNLTEATRLAARRLSASGLPPAVGVIHGHGERARRTAAALLFPVWHKKTSEKTDVTRLMNLVLRLEDRSESTENIAEAADSASAAV